MKFERLGVSRSILSFSYFNKEHSIYDFFLSDWESSGDEGYKNIRETERKTDGWRNRGKKEKHRSFVFRKRKRELG